MQLGLFLSIGAALTAVIGFLGPFPGSFGPLPGSADRARPTVSRCLALEYDPSSVGSWMPVAIRLNSTPAELLPRPDAPGYLATLVWRDLRESDVAAWRPAGRDSVDIAWYHSPILRLPLPDTLLPTGSRGRGGWWQYPNLYSAILNEGHFRVRAIEISCAQSG